MKFNFRKIASVLASAVMVSSTVALAAAANFPAPFVSSGAGDYAVVYGSAAPATGGDNVAAADINAFLSQRVTTPSTPVVVTNQTPINGDFVEIQTTHDKFNLGNKANEIETTPLDSGDLPVVLADGTYTNQAGNDFDYKQKITVGPLELNFQRDTSFNSKNPFVGFVEAANTNVLNYTLRFPTAVEGGGAGTADSPYFEDLKNTVINILGRDYYISNAQSTSNGLKLTLLDTANSLRINEGDTQTVTVGNQTVKIQVVSISGTDAATATVSLAVNDVELSNDLSAGETSKIRGTDMYVGVKKVSVTSRSNGVQSAVVTVGTGQLTLEEGQQVQLNGKDISSLDQYQDWKVYSYFDNSTSDISSMTLKWDTKRKVALMPGQEWVMPGFEGVKISMGDFVTPTAEETTLQDSSDSAGVHTELTDGPVDFSLFYANATGIQGLGADDADVLVVNDTASPTVNLNVSSGTEFVATWKSGKDAESYIFQLTSVTGDGVNNETVLTNLADDSKVTFTETPDQQNVGSINLELISSDVDAEKATIAISAAASGDVYSDRVITKGGLLFMLPTTANVDATSFDMAFTEADKDGNIGSGSNFTVTLSPSTDGVEPTATDVQTYDKTYNSDVKIGYVISDLATYLVWNNPTSGAKDMTVNYHPTESYGQVYITESKVQLSEGGSGGSAGTLVVTDSEVSSVSGKNLIVVGGSCVNTVAARLLNSQSPLCEAAWTSATNAGAGAFLIQTFANPYTSGKVATLVAGYDATDTTNAANALKTETIDTTAGKKYVKLAGSTLQLV